VSGFLCVKSQIRLISASESTLIRQVFMQKIENSHDWGTIGWDKYFASKGPTWRNKDYRYLTELFDVSSLKGSLIDVGCALGDGLSYLKSSCPDIDSWAGTDFSANAVDACRNKVELGGMDFFQHDIHSPITKKYNNIICLQTLEHLENPSDALKNLIDATIDLLIVSVPYKNRRPDENHIWSFDECDFTSLVDQFSLDQRERNIFWIVNKSSSVYSFKPVSSKFNFIRKLKKYFSGNRH
jgi:hypothetical protein